MFSDGYCVKCKCYVPYNVTRFYYGYISTCAHCGSIVYGF